MKCRKVMAKRWLTVIVNDLDLFVRIAIALYEEHDKERFLWSDTDDFERGRRWVFRGQRKRQWDIVSTLERCHHSGYASCIGLKKLEQKLVEEFERDASIFISLNGWSKFDVLALMRHYEVPTRLVDFSESPFVALYFGIADKEPQEDFCVWAVCIDALKEYPPLDDIVVFKRHDPALTCQKDAHELFKCFEDNFGEATEKRTTPNVFYAYPRRGNTRLSAQSGLFLVQSALGVKFMDDLKESLGCKDANATTIKLTEIYKENRVPDVSIFSNLIKFVFPHEMGNRCISLLRSMNISPKILYTGLEGISKSLSQYLPLIDERLC